MVKHSNTKGKSTTLTGYSLRAQSRIVKPICPENVFPTDVLVFAWKNHASYRSFSTREGHTPGARGGGGWEADGH